jgi:Predicted membrane protein (DUF2306)
MHSRLTKAVLLMPTAVAVWFLNSYAFQYFAVDPDRYGIYWPRREWLLVHIIAGGAALLLGPLQLWLGLNRRELSVHRILGPAYALGVLVSACSAFYLARHTDFGWIAGMGFTAMGIAWIVSTGFATIAILRQLTEQHREWMIRSYVLTFGFVTFRIFTEVLQVSGVGTTLEQIVAASWFSWSVPLLLTEWVIQGRRVLALSPSRRGGVVPRNLNPIRRLKEIGGVVSWAKAFRRFRGFRTFRQPAITGLQLSSLRSSPRHSSLPIDAAEPQYSHEAPEERPTVPCP